MKIPTKGRYAVSAMLDLALHDNIKPLTIAEIAEKQNISLSYLEQIFAVLRKNGLVRGMRGPGGGYRLADSADSITIAKIIYSVDESALSKNSVEAAEYLPYEIWADLSKQIFSFLDGISLAKCISNHETREAVEKLGEQTFISDDTNVAGQVAA
jgi:Rrf2 family iron-sulfur cluster assembly transcriptional regulator